MDQKKKQLVLLGVVGALALGAGGYFGFLRDNGGPKQIGSGAGTAQKKERQANPTTKTVKKESSARKAEDKPKGTEKKVREEAEEQRTEKRTRDTKDRKIEKKKVLPPAA